MWDLAASARAALAGDHRAVTRVDIWHSGFPVYTLIPTGGSVTMDATRAVRSNLSCELTDPTGNLSRGDVDDLLNPYDCEIAPWRGVRVDGRDELAPLGVFRLTGRDVSDSGDGLSIRLDGQDRAIGYQGPMSSPLAVSAGTPIEVVIQRLLASRQPGLSMLSMNTGFTVGPLIFPPDIDVWAEAQKLAESAGAHLFHDRTGQVRMALAGPVSDRPVARYAEGDGLLIGVERSEDSDTIKNVVKAENTDGSISVEVGDLDPTSPTYARGRYGRHPYVLKNPHITTIYQAQQAGSTRLAYELGRSETVAFTAVPDPCLDVNEVVTVHRPRVGLEDRGVVTASITLPLSATEPMRVGCRQSRLAQDGRVLDELPKVAA